MQSGANLVNDVQDAESGVDGADRLGPQRITQSGLLPAASVRRAYRVVFILAALLGGLMVARGGLPLVLLARMALNAIDGMLAREHGQASALGALLNELGDLVSDAALYLPFAALPGLRPGLVVLFVLAALLAEVAGILGASMLQRLLPRQFVTQPTTEHLFGRWSAPRKRDRTA